MSSASIRRFEPADIPLGMRLKEQAGWNQTEADWRRFLALAPQGCFVAERDGQGVGTAAAITLGDGERAVGWIAMVLVDPDQRGQGTGTALVQHALDYLDARGIASVRLDATEFGEPIYRRLGFERQFELVRLLRPAGTFKVEPSAEPEAEAQGRRAIRLLEPRDLSAVIELDRTVTRTDRAALLERLVGEQPAWSFVLEADGQVRGYATARPGAKAVHLGPAATLDGGTGEALLGSVLDVVGDRAVLVDVPAEQTGVLGWLSDQGFVEQRRFVRMCRGKIRGEGMVCEQVAMLLASSGPEKG